LTEKDKFRVVVAGIVTNQGDILIGKSVEEDGKTVSGQWHLPGGHLEDEDMKEAVKREMEEETGLEVEVHQIVDVHYDEIADLVRVVYHCESDERELDIDDTSFQDMKWVEVENLEEELGEHSVENFLPREDVQKFLEKLEKMPVF